MTGLLCGFPRWSPEAVITEAARNWNLRHPSRPFDPAGGDWAFTRTVIDSWLRHAVSNYDAICHPGNRLALQKEIQQRARRAYPWLSRPADPRSSGGGDARAQPIVRPFDQLGHSLAELASARSAALLALQSAKRKHEWQNIQALEAEIAEADHEMQTLWRMVLPDTQGERDVFIKHETGDYFWGGEHLSPNHVEALPITCPDCQARIYRTKRPVNCGGGIHAYIISCHCSMAFEARKWPIVLCWDEDGITPMLRLKNLTQVE
jgi:hypothetical protein